MSQEFGVTVAPTAILGSAFADASDPIPDLTASRNRCYDDPTPLCIPGMKLKSHGNHGNDNSSTIQDRYYLAIGIIF